MNESPVRQKVAEGCPELLEGLGLLERRFPLNVVAERVVCAAMAQPGVAGARLWRVDRGTPEVWAQAGTRWPCSPQKTNPGGVSDSDNDPALWAGVLGSDEFRMRVLEVRGAQP